MQGAVKIRITYQLHELTDWSAACTLVLAGQRPGSNFLKDLRDPFVFRFGGNQFSEICERAHQHLTG
jgi:hypothetical protein